MEKRRRRGLFSLLFFPLIFVLLLLLVEELTPIKLISEIKNENKSLSAPLKELTFIYGVKVDYLKDSILSKEDLKQLSPAFDYIVLPVDTPSYYSEKNITIKDTDCRPLFSVYEEKSGLGAFIRNLKFKIFYNINRELAFFYRYKNLKKDLFFSEFDPIRDTCFVAVNEIALEHKYLEDGKRQYFPDLNYLSRLIVNKAFNSLDEALKKGNSYVYFFEDPKIKVVVKTDKGEKFLGDMVSSLENPEIFVSVDKNYITAVYLNGKLLGYYKGNFSIKPKTAGFYNFVVFRYTKSIANFYFGFDIVAITNTIFVE